MKSLDEIRDSVALGEMCRNMTSKCQPFSNGGMVFIPHMEATLGMFSSISRRSKRQ